MFIGSLADYGTMVCYQELKLWREASKACMQVNRCYKSTKSLSGTFSGISISFSGRCYLSNLSIQFTITHQMRESLPFPYLPSSIPVSIISLRIQFHIRINCAAQPCPEYSSKFACSSLFSNCNCWVKLL